MQYQTLHEVLAGSKDSKTTPTVEKKNSKLVYLVKESETSYLLDDGHGGAYYIGKLPGSIAYHPIWRIHVKVSRG